MPEITATEASRSFADLLDGVEHRGERYTIVRRGRVIAQLEPVSTASGAAAKALLRRHRVDSTWSRGRRAEKRVDRRGAVLSQLLLDSNVLISAERSDVDLDELILDEDVPAIAAISVAELGVGVALATGKRRKARRAFFDDIVDNVPIIAYDLAVARAHTELLVATRRQVALGAPTT